MMLKGLGGEFDCLNVSLNRLVTEISWTLYYGLSLVVMLTALCSCLHLFVMYKKE